LVGIRSLAYSSFDIESKKYIRGINDIKEIERLEEERKIQAKQYIQNFNNEYLSENYSSS
jgi:hypothetical protein